MRITYDCSVDAAYLYFSDGVSPGSVRNTHSLLLPETGAQLNVDCDSSGFLVGVEVLGASRVLPGEVLQEAERIG